MRKSFFLITFLLIALWPSLAGCAAGSSLKQPVRREVATQPARDLGSVPTTRDAGTPSTPPVGMDAGRTPIDAGRPIVDAGRTPLDAGRTVSPAPPPPPSPVDANLVRIRLTDPRIGACPGGWKIRLWLAYPAEESAPGAALERSVIRYDGWSSISLWCDGRSPEWFVWEPFDWTALDTDIFAELSLGGVDLRSSVRLCEDPLSLGSGIRPIIMWDAARRNSCPP